MIKINDLLPLLRPGWVAMNKTGMWSYFADKPKRNQEEWIDPLPFCLGGGIGGLLPVMFDIAPYDGDWKDSLIEIKKRKEQAQKQQMLF